MSIGSRRTFARLVAAAALSIMTLALAGCGEDKQAPTAAAPAPTVTVAAVEKTTITPTVTFNGRIEAVDTVDLRARVEGFIEKRLFEEGAEVKAGDLMIVLEKNAYEAQVGQVKGQITAAEGTLRLAKIEVDRQTALVKRQAAAQTMLDTAEAKYAQALGELQRLQAALKRSELDLSYTDIKAPIDGRVGRFAFSVGDFVSPSSGALAMIVRQDPMYVTFPVTARTLLEVRKEAAASGRDPRNVTVKLRLPDGSIYGETGKINFVDVEVDPTTDTVTIRATIPNPLTGRSARVLVHNQLVGVIIERAQPEQALVVPQASVVVDQAGQYVLVVDKDNKVEQRRIRTGGTQGSAFTVTEGLKEGDRIIVDGLQKVRPGQVVSVSAAAKSGG
jgi:membrane fusion protein (multidrug efflux system)